MVTDRDLIRSPDLKSTGPVKNFVIPALVPTLDKSLQGDRSLCPVKALCYYLDRTSDLRQNMELVFVAFKKYFDKDISPATISSWIKQTVILCYDYSLYRRPSHCIRLKPMMSEPLLLLRPSSRESPWSKFCQPATGSHITPSHSFI